ncbi:nuclear transport factor 2 family protein [Accumulibacter sp.]|uniref:YybH family protein n=1 Tax=Accumulibacter sp. TaxID=2053492 RepID=UPI00260BD12D|nr:nuclear transport factor 2 family protein [Accumulibacter sp.]
MRFIRFLAAVALSLSLLGGATAQLTNSGLTVTDDANLRGLLVAATHAVNTRNFRALADIALPEFTLITVDDQQLVGADAIEKYYARLVDGPDAVLRKIQVEPIAEETSIVARDAAAAVFGRSAGKLTFRHGGERSIKLRWSVNVVKEGDRWKLASAHVSANLLANPVLDIAREDADLARRPAALAGLAVGLAGGLLIMAFWLRRRSRRRTPLESPPAN